MSRAKYFTGIFVLFGLIGIVVWQTAAIIFPQIETISIFAEEIDSFNPLVSHCITAIFGILIGHWFIPPGGSRG